LRIMENNKKSLNCLYRRTHVYYIYINIYIHIYIYIGFGGLEVACWPLVPKFVGSNPAEAVGFLRAKKNPQHAFLRRASKAVCPMLQICGM